MYNFDYFVTKQQSAETLDDESYMRLALQATERAKASGNIPMGALLLIRGKHLVEYDTSIEDINPLNTASLNVLRKAIDMMPHKVRDSVLYCTVEPDTISVLSAVKSGINEVVFGVYNYRDGFVSSDCLRDLQKFDIHYKGGVLAKQCMDVLPTSIKDYCGVEPKQL